MAVEPALQVGVILQPGQGFLGKAGQEAEFEGWVLAAPEFVDEKAGRAGQAVLSFGVPYPGSHVVGMCAEDGRVGYGRFGDAEIGEQFSNFNNTLLLLSGSLCLWSLCSL